MFPVAVTSVADLVVEQFDYCFTPTGMPLIELTVLNPSAQVLHADLYVKLNKAIASPQNEYRYREIGAMNAMRGISFMPGIEQQLLLPHAPLLKPGDYEAEVRLQALSDSKTDHMDFNLSEETNVQAKANRERSNRASPVTNVGALDVRDVSFIVMACLIVLIGITNLRKAAATKKRKRGISKP